MDIQNLERKRKILIFLRILSVVVAFVPVALIYIVAAKIIDENLIWLIVGGSIGIIVLYYIYTRIFLKQYKDFCIQNYLPDFNIVYDKTKKKYIPNEILELLALNEKGSFDSAVRQTVSQHYFLSGEYRSVEFTQNKLMVKKMTEHHSILFDEEVGTLKYIFNGHITEFNTSIADSPILISTKKLRKIQKLFTKIETRDEEFDDIFIVTCENKKDADAFLNNDVINKLKLLYETSPSKEFFILNYNNKIYFGYNKHKSLYPKLNKKLDEDIVMETSKNDFNYVKVLIEEIIK